MSGSRFKASDPERQNQAHSADSVADAEVDSAKRSTVIWVVVACLVFLVVAAVVILGLLDLAGAMSFGLLKPLPSRCPSRGFEAGRVDGF